jgi:hypothetical protein
MKSGTAFVPTLFALVTFPILAQQPSPANQQNNPATQQNPSDPETAPQNGLAANPETPTVKMNPLNGELVSKLDSKTAKTGDNVVVRTKTSAKTADGTEIPEGSKLVGHVIGVQPSGAAENSQVALQFDHLELNGGQSLPIRSQIQSIAPPAGAASTGGSAAVSGGTMSSASDGSANSGANGANGGNQASSAPQRTSGDPGAAAAGNGSPAAGTVVAKTGKIDIQTTSIPGVLLANNAPGQQDPRMAAASSILLGAKRDIQLDGGTQMVVGVSAAGGGTHDQH